MAKDGDRNGWIMTMTMMDDDDGRTDRFSLANIDLELGIITDSMQ